jgi:glycosyltransferase involved in cell wall biosynthesis
MQEGIKFPDELFPITNHNDYDKIVLQGMRTALSKRVLFCGICRNVENVIERNILRIEKSGSYFKSYDIFIYENDSTDNTKAILEEYHSKRRIFLKSDTRGDSNYVKMLEAGKDPVHYNRCKVLASCRNVYLDYLKHNHRNYDYVCVIDLDIMGGWSYNGLMHSVCILEDQKNGAVTANGMLSEATNKLDLEQVDEDKYIMYDSFVFRPLHITKGIENYQTSRYNAVKERPGNFPVVVNSNFNGMGLYKVEAINGLTYEAKQWDAESVDADHVVLHRKIKKRGYDIIFNPSMLTSYSNHKYSKMPLEKE